MTVRLFSSTDAGAPVLSKTASGNLIVVLRACLVDGYGTRTGAGWSMPFSDIPNDKAVFRGVSGVNDFLRVYNEFSKSAHINGYASMTDVDTGTEEYPNNDEDKDAATDSWQTFIKENSDDYDKWFVVASEEWFYFYVPNLGSNLGAVSGFFFGVMDSVDDTRASKNVITGHWANANGSEGITNTGWKGLFHSTSSPPMYARRDYQNIAGRRAELYRRFTKEPYDYPNKVTGKSYYGKHTVRTALTPFDYYGALPNLFIDISNSLPTVRGGDLVSVEGVTCVAFINISEVIAIEYEVNSG